MVINGQAVKGAKRLANHLLKDENEKISVLEITGTAVNDNLREALHDMEVLGRLTKSQTGKTLYHANINPRANERLTPEQYTQAADRLMEKLGFEGQPRAIVLHEKKGRQHAHLVVQLTDVTKAKLKPISNNYYKHKEVSRELEKAFQLEQTFEEKSGRSYNQSEAHQTKKLGMRQKSLRNIMRDCFEYSEDGSSFVSKLAENELYLAQGNRLVVIDSLGNPLSLTRQLRHFATSKDIKHLLSDIVNELPKIDDVQRQIRDLNNTKLLDDTAQEMMRKKNTYRQKRQMNIVQDVMIEKVECYRQEIRDKGIDRER